MRKKNTKQLFEKLTVIDAGAKGKSVAKAPDGRIIFLSNAIPGDVVDIQTTKKRSAYYEGTAVVFHHTQIKELKRYVNTLAFVEVVNGSTWPMSINSIINKKK